MILANTPLLAALTAWLLAQAIKVPLDYCRTGKWHWHLIVRAGGMPSSHVSLVASLAWSIGLQNGFQNALFAIAAVVVLIVIYDAAGVRRAAGQHARAINLFIMDLPLGHPLKQEELKEVLGHTPNQVASGTVLGIIVAWAMWWWMER